MKNILIVAVLTFLFNSNALIFSMQNNLSYNHKQLTQAFINNEDPIYPKEQLQKNLELLKFALDTYKPIYTDEKYKQQVKCFYSHTKYLYQQELFYLNNINQNIKLIFKHQNYSAIIDTYSTTFNSKKRVSDYFGHDFYHKKHAIQVSTLVNQAVRNKIEHLFKTKSISKSEYNQAILENIDDGFLLAATLIEGLNWTNTCIAFLNKIFE